MSFVFLALDLGWPALYGAPQPGTPLLSLICMAAQLVFYFQMNRSDCKILCWNVRGLNGAARRASVRNLISSSGASVVCLQETKISQWNDFLLKETLGQALASQTVCLPANGTAGGVLIAASDQHFSLNHLYTTEHTITANICSLADNTKWSITGVYGPQSDEDKVNFLAEFASIKLLTNPAWIALGDFNLICSAGDKNMGRINHRMIQRFNRTLDDLQLIELSLNGKRFTWSNGHDTPTMSKIDHCFATLEWLDLFPRSDLQAIASLISDHSPLFLQGDVNFDFYRGFRFEAFWTTMPGFLDLVEHNWNQPVHTSDAILRMHIKMRRLAVAIKIWKSQHCGNLQLRLAIVQVALLCLEKAQEFR